MDFRKDINGLRAIAVLAVVLFHFNPAWLPGGFSGVDIFFVISGYLITGIIFRKLEAGTFGVLAFYKSRAQRIIPALAVLCFVLLGVGWFYLLPLEYKQLGKHIASSLGFFSNFTYWGESGYFTASAHEKWLLHTWSLSVEWQFYMVYPIVLLALSKLMPLRYLRGLILATCVGGFGFCVFSSLYWPQPAFYLLPSRAWELLAGGVACLYPITLGARHQRLLEGTGLLMMLASFVLLREEDVWPGYLGLLPVLGTLAVIVAARQDSFLTNNPFSQWTGKISYSLYLWHWPLVVFLSYDGMLHDTPHLLAGIVMAFALAAASYRFIESTASRRPSPKQRWAFAQVSALIVSLFVGAAAVNATEGAVTSFRSISVSDRARFVQDYATRQKNLYDAYWLKCDAFSAFTERHQQAIDPACTRKQGEGGVFLWGDSHAQALSLGLRTELPRGTPFYQVASAGCGPSLTDDTGRSTDKRTTCNYSNRLALSSIQALRPDVVVMAQKSDHNKVHWDDIAARLKSYGVKHIVLMGPLPQWAPSLPSVIANRHWGGNDAYITDAALDQSIMAANRAMPKLIDGTSVDFVSLIDKLCIANSCLVRLGGDNSLLQIDDGHLSEQGSVYIVKNYVMPELYKK
jgi:peptidoglycan/LPS O-acetylase OafA/YrhL